MIGLDQCMLRNPATRPYNPFRMASDIFHSSFTKPILLSPHLKTPSCGRGSLLFFFCIRENLLQETHEEAQDPKGQYSAPHSNNDHCDSKCPIIHIEIPPDD